MTTFTFNGCDRMSDICLNKAIQIPSSKPGKYWSFSVPFFFFFFFFGFWLCCLACGILVLRLRMGTRGPLQRKPGVSTTGPTREVLPAFSFNSYVTTARLHFKEAEKTISSPNCFHFRTYLQPYQRKMTTCVLVTSQSIFTSTGAFLKNLKGYNGEPGTEIFL